jgi:glycosyltransferase involved in cell wall biosynthesis
MKVLFIARASIYRNRGGDTIQLQKTAEYLAPLGVQADIRLADEAIDYSEYDLLHFFNLTRPADILNHYRNAAKPFVVSPLFVDYTESDRKTRKGFSRLASALVSTDRIEYVKVIARRLLNGERIASRRYWWYGQRGSIRRVMGDAAMLLPNSANEYRRLQERFKMSCPYRVIPNAVDRGLFAPAADDHRREKDLVVCAARIEGIKNQLNLIRAVNETGLRLILIGDPAVNQRSYYEACRRAAGPGVTFLNAIPHEELAAYYSRAQVHALPSWFETTGLSSLEAAAMGCSLVITDRGDTREYFGDEAVYCDPGSPASIRDALTKAVGKGASSVLQEKIAAQYNWQQTAASTYAAYRTILGRD